MLRIRLRRITLSMRENYFLMHRQNTREVIIFEL